MLTVDQRQRPSASMLLQHAWITNTARHRRPILVPQKSCIRSAQVEEDAGGSSLMVQRLQAFAQMSALKQFTLTQLVRTLQNETIVATLVCFAQPWWNLASSVSCTPLTERESSKPAHSCKG